MEIWLGSGESGKIPQKKLNMWCTLCDKKICGGITRLKQHLAHIPGIMKKVIVSIQEKEKQQKEKQRN